VPAPAPWRWTLDVSIALAAGLIGTVLLSGGGRFHLLGFPVSVRSLYTPVFVLTLLMLARIAAQVRPRLRVPT
jgi:hypothetical protein